MKLDRKAFFEQIKDGFFNDLSADFESFKSMISAAAPVFGRLETEIKEKEDGGKTVTFIDVDEADMVLAPEGVEEDEIDTDMSTIVMTIHLNEDNVIKIVEHSFGIFTPANKDQVLLYASLIGKKISF